MEARRTRIGAAAAGVIANALFTAFYASFAVQHFSISASRTASRPSSVQPRITPASRRTPC